MAYIYNLGETKKGINRFLLVVNIKGSDKLPLRIVADTEEEARIIADDIEREKKAEKSSLLKKKICLSDDDVKQLKNYLRVYSRRYSRELRRRKSLGEK